MKLTALWQLKKNLSLQEKSKSTVLTSASRQETATFQASGALSTRPTPCTTTTDKCQLLYAWIAHVKWSCLSISRLSISSGHYGKIRMPFAIQIRRLLTRGLTADSPHWQVKLAEMGYTVCSFHLRTQYTRPDVAISHSLPNLTPH